jgi:glycosyltransferase involved in cell wall biosynthesis
MHALQQNPMAEIRILHILWSAGVGGIEKQVYDLVRAQQQNGSLSVEVLICKDGGIYADKFIELNVPCHILKMTGALDFSPARASRIKNLFAGFDVLHFHSFNAWIAWFAAKSGKPIVYSEHGNFAIGRKRGMGEMLNRSLQRKFLNAGVDFISFNSEFTRGVAQKIFGLHNVNQEVVSNGIDFANRPDADALNIPDFFRRKLKGKFVAGTCSRFVAVKKIERLIRSFSEFSSDKPDAVLLLCGDGPGRKGYEKLIKELNLIDKTIITGFTDHALSFQALMNVAVYPSAGEAFGLAAVESLSLGIPVIVFKDGGGLTEIVSGIDRDNIVNDEHELTQRMTYYYSEKNDSLLMKNNRSGYARRYDLTFMEERFFARYKKLVS